MKRIVTRPDFDGVVCAVLLRCAKNITSKIKWAEPNEIQAGKTKIFKNDIMANLPYSPECCLWFDHHISNKPSHKFNGAFAIAPSAAGVIYKYYRKTLDNRFDELVLNTDIIDSADLTKDQVKYPQNYPYIILSMSIENHDYKDESYWNKLVNLLIKKNIDEILEDKEVKKRCKKLIKENKKYEKHLIKHTKMVNNISITDFTNKKKVSAGNRFLVYPLFKNSIANVKIRFVSSKKKYIQISIGSNIFNDNLNVNIGKLLSQFGGGGHAKAGGCTLKAKNADKKIQQILDIMFKNKEI